MKRRSLLACFGAAPFVSRPARARRELPVVGFMLVINLNTAAALDLDPRPALPVSANEVIR